MSKRYGLFLASRLGSSRLPGKALLPLGEWSMLQYVMKRLAPAQEVSEFVLATTNLPADQALVDLASQEGFQVFRGSQDDVMERFVEAERRFPCDYVIRVTADCPLINAEMIDHGVRQAREVENFDLFTSKSSNYPVGLDFEIYSAERMKEIHGSNEPTVLDREHLTKFMYDHAERFRIFKAQAPSDWPASACSFTVDTPADYERVQKIIKGEKTFQISVQDLIIKANNL